ncbi:MAG: helix-turn-helix domain-containing protein [Miltoncostaeaceae bacterium]
MSRPPARAPADNVAINGREADLDALLEAVAKHAKLLLLADALPGHIAAAAERVDDCYRALGIDTSSRRRRPGPRKDGAIKPGGLPDFILTTLRDREDGATSTELVEYLGLPMSKVSVVLAGLVNRGLVHTTPGPNGASRGQTYHLTTPPDTEEA